MQAGRLRASVQLPFPKRFSYSHAGMFAALLCTVLLGEGNPVSICVTIAALILVGTFAFNAAGGIANPTGAYVLFTVMFTGLLGAVTKALLNEPLLEFVPNADQTFLVYLVGTCSMAGAVMLSKRLARRTPLLAGRLTLENTTRVVVGCLAGGILIPMVVYTFFGGGNGSLAGVIRQLNIALPLSVLIAVYQRVKQTNGRSSFSWPGMVGALYSTYIGLFGFSKEGMFSAWVAWMVAAAAARLRVSLLQLGFVGAIGIGALLILVPYAQYGRNFRNLPNSGEIAYQLLSHPLETRQLALSSQEEMPMDLYHWYRKPEGILDRLTLVPIDSALIAKTDETGTIGLSNLLVYFENIIPHFILPDKPVVNTGNQYAHKIGMLSDEDLTTGISFSPYSEAYHLYGWLGVLFVMPAILCMLFTVMQSVSGDTEQSPWGLFYIASFAHLAAEGSLAFPVFVSSFGTEALVATSFFMIYITPIVGSLIVGPAKKTVPLNRPLVGMAGRQRPA